MRGLNAHQVALCLLAGSASVGAYAQATPETAGSQTFWNHNGSVMHLVTSGPKREFVYESPRQGMLDAGATPGTLLFSGELVDGQYVGTAYIFSRKCGKYPYQVAGRAESDGRVVLRGDAPRVNANCQIEGYKHDVLEFDLLDR